MLEVLPTGKSNKSAVFVPFTKEMVPTIDLDAGQVVLSLSDDFFVVPENEGGEKKIKDEK